MINILISTGGSGGHVIPATILNDHLKHEFNTFMTSDVRGTKFLNNDKYNVEIINASKISKNVFLLPFQIFSFFHLVIKSLFFLKKKKLKYYYQQVATCLYLYALHPKFLILSYIYLNQIWF